MKYRYFLIFILILSCTNVKVNRYEKPIFSSKGFAYIYSKEDYENKVIKKNINSISHIISINLDK